MDFGATLCSARKPACGGPTQRLGGVGVAAGRAANRRMPQQDVLGALGREAGDPQATAVDDEELRRLAGLGILWLPDYMARPHVATGALVPLFAGWRIDPMPLWIAWPPNRHLSRKVRVFIDWIVELMAARAV